MMDVSTSASVQVARVFRRPMEPVARRRKETAATDRAFVRADNVARPSHT